MRVINKSDGKEYRRVFAEFDPFNTPVLYELGKIEFCDEKTIKYSPKSYFKDIYFNI